ncbi:lipopolysaccharide export system permease protein [Flavobacterium succinicans]|uniref:Lipopolysaccharide export system permease protein n=1 Tax=Flavobacterium succinicans TaxID=29536 RepID=A0A1I4TPD2_9FLAO|nr:lipopolysaccharide export system permease protein [Flavobacterium succinicans]
MVTFTTVFVILFFIFILQTVWLFITELAGKDLDLIMVVKFLLFSMPRIIPLVLPLSVLLASIMTFGSFSENYELAAIKSSGISLQRCFRTLIVFITLLSIVAFMFANSVIPYAEYKFISFRRNIAQVKPALAIAEGQFNTVGIYNIKVNKKSGEKGNLLSDVTIHKKSIMGDGNKTVIKAKTGELISNEASNLLQLVLKDGYYYEDVIPKKYEDRDKMPFVKSAFKKDIINIDLSKLNTPTVEETKETNTKGMLDVTELRYTIDSLTKNKATELKSFTENISQKTATSLISTPITANDTLEKRKIINSKDPLAMFTIDEKASIYKNALANTQSTVLSIEGTLSDLKMKQKNINAHEFVIYEKFVIAFACFLMFFIGAPLGAIIRKGGIGLPIVFAVLIFITFHFINTFGKRVSQEDGLTPFVGAWMSSFILTPLAILLTYRAINDIGIINLDRITEPFQKLFKKIFPSKN